ncbi:family 16 glycosylhydrolase [Fulvivirga sp. M361]|uniref:family 16 glycosylhydrolase n=1 Tax=Fulvivirga sp. M361 TaxID=2594266 RepID=UPI00210599A9|nr:family 16 glycosylhydrolase [Fulvivirga sp. M361]
MMLFFCFCTHQGQEQKKTSTGVKVVAHRGAWKSQGHPQNSIASLREAIASGYAGSEFDVNMTADDSLVVTHGPNYHKMPIEKTDYGSLARIELGNGEKLPTLKEYILAGTTENSTTKLFCEIKSSEISKKRTLNMTEKILDLIKKLRVESIMVFISFDYDALKKVIAVYPNAQVQYLGGDRSPERLRVDGITGVNYRYQSLRKHPERIIAAKMHNVLLNSGTVNHIHDMDWLIANQLDYISTDEPELLSKRISVSSVTSGWELVWSDEFDQPGKPDSTKWGYEIGFIRNVEDQYYTGRSENARVEAGLLILESHKERIKNDAYVSKEAKNWQNNREYAHYTSSSLTTKDLAEWTYGKIEVRAKLPKGVGLWPAVWMLGENWGRVGWPECGEIDIMEHVGFKKDSIFGTVHTTAFNHMKGTQVGKTIFIEKPYDDFHTYAIDWSEDRIDFLLDDMVYHHFENRHETEAEWPFNQPFHLKLNIAVGGMLGGREGVDDTIFPQRMAVDYVRVYQRK